MFHVLSDVFNLDAQYFWHEKHLPKDIDAIVLPGGFSYGDRLRAGVIAAHSPVIEDVKKLAKKGTPVLGVCNGFQILVESGLLPGVLLKNKSLNFMCKWTNLIVENNTTPFTNKLQMHQKIPIPIANGEGRYYVDAETLKQLKKKNQIVFRYEEAVNGSSYQIAGVCNEEGNVVGMMPHPERATESEINPIDNKPSSLIFESLLAKVGAKN
jgi:phosphoribosylformylglycinamidine synthase